MPRVRLRLVLGCIAFCMTSPLKIEAAGSAAPPATKLSPNGAFNVTEFGTVADKEQFKALYAYSPYHRVRDGANYPALLFLTGANDPRVDPMQSRKMTSRLQAASPRSTTLLRTIAEAGHGIGSSLTQRIEEGVDVDSFLFHELGFAYQPAPDAEN